MDRPYDRLDGVIWYDGKLVAWGEANLHVLSHGLHYASCVFEGERAYGGETFKCSQHSQRLKRSAQLLDFEMPYAAAEPDAAKRLASPNAQGPTSFSSRTARFARRSPIASSTGSRGARSSSWRGDGASR